MLPRSTFQEAFILERSRYVCWTCMLKQCRRPYSKRRVEPFIRYGSYRGPVTTIERVGIPQRFKQEDGILVPKRRKELIRLQPCGPLLPGLESLDRLRLKPRSEIKSEDGRVLNAKKAAVDRKEEGDDSLKDEAERIENVFFNWAVDSAKHQSRSVDTQITAQFNGEYYSSKSERSLRSGASSYESLQWPSTSAGPASRSQEVAPIHGETPHTSTSELSTGDSLPERPSIQKVMRSRNNSERTLPPSLVKHMIAPKVGRPSVQEVMQRKSTAQLQTRTYRCSAQFATNAYGWVTSSPEIPPGELLNSPTSNIRKRLSRWQKEHEMNERKNSEASRLGQIKPLVENIAIGTELDDRIVDDFQDDDNTEGDMSNMIMDEDGLLQNDNQRYLRRGDMVALRTSKDHTLGIFIRNFEPQCQFYTMQGKWTHIHPKSIPFSVPGFVSPQELDSIIPYLPKTEVPPENLDIIHSMDMSVPREVGAEVVKRMQRFYSQSNDIYRNHASQLDQAHEKVADYSKIRYATVSHITRKVLSLPETADVSYETLWAAHRALVEDDLGFSLDPKNHRITGNFEIRPLREAKLIKNVRDWLRDYQESVITRTTTRNSSALHVRTQADEQLTEDHETQRHVSIVTGFVEKARRLIQNSRQCRRPLTDSGCIGPSSVKVDPKEIIPSSATRDVLLEEFSDEETVIIRFVEYWALRGYMRKGSALSSLGPMLLRAINMYEASELDQSTGIVLLQELGVIPPWENRLAFDTRLALPGHLLDHAVDKLRLQAAQTASDTLEDKLKDLRKDWGQLEVYCVDGDKAVEIDDGFSIEKVEGTESEHWIHVHIANPTAFLSPTHPQAQFAAQLTETLYFPDKAYTMLSPKFTQNYCSIRNGRPVLTFSARMNTQGDILDVNITPGRVHNVKYFTPRLLTAALSGKDDLEENNKTYSIGGSIPSRPKKDDLKRLNGKQIANLKKIEQIGAAHRAKRKAISYRFSRPEAAVWIKSRGQLEELLPYRKRARQILGDPFISMQIAVFEPNPELKDEAGVFVVSDMMILACEVAATWCQERNLPVIYRGTIRDPERPSPDEFKKSVLDPTAAKIGYVPYFLRHQYLTMLGGGIASTTPIKHSTLGTNAYTKVTSPIRRYGDMLAHWQIEAALVHEKRTGKTLVGSTDDQHSFLPFSRSQVDDMIPVISEREKIINDAKKKAEIHWAMQFLLRAHFFKEAELPRSWRAYVLFDIALGGNKRGFKKVVIIAELGIYASLRSACKLTKEVKLGEWWEVAIDAIGMFERSLFVVPLRRLEKAPDV